MASLRWILQQIKTLEAREQEDLLMKLMDPASLKNIKEARDARTKIVSIKDYIDAAKNLYRDRGKVQGLSTGINKVDEMTQGMLGGELIVIGGQSHHGKTQLATNIAYNVAKQGNRVTFVTLEMTKPQITERFMQVAESEDIGDLPIDFQESMNLDYQDISFLTGKAKRMGSRLIIIDHLHYFVRDPSNQSNEIGAIVKNFSEFSKAHDIPVILVSHVTKLPWNKRPELNDFRDSSFIGQDADIALIVWSDTRENADDPDMMEIILRKNRPRGMQKRFNILWRKEGGKLLENEPHKTKADIHIPTEEEIPQDWQSDY